MQFTITSMMRARSVSNLRARILPYAKATGGTCGDGSSTIARERIQGVTANMRNAFGKAAGELS